MEPPGEQEGGDLRGIFGYAELRERGSFRAVPTELATDSNTRRVSSGENSSSVMRSTSWLRRSGTVSAFVNKFSDFIFEQTLAAGTVPAASM